MVRLPRGGLIGRRPADADTAGLTGIKLPVNTQARWLGAKRGVSSPSLISRVTAKSNATLVRMSASDELDGRRP